MDACPPAGSRSPESLPLPPLDPARLLVRTARPRDLEGLTDLLALSFHPPEGWITLLYPFLKLGIQEDLRARLRSRSPHYCCFAAIALGPATTDAGPVEVVTGTVEIGMRSPCSQSRHEYPYISNLAVIQAYRRQGIARRLLTQCEPLAREWGYQDIYLHVLETNYRAQTLYRACGYQVEQAETTWVTQLLHQPRRLLLRKRLA